MSLIVGKERLLSVRPAGQGDYVVIATLTGNSFSETVEFLNTTTRYSGKYRSRVPVLQDYSIPFSALMPEVLAVDRVGLKELRAWKDDEQLLDWKLEAFNKNFINIGQAYISDLNEDAPASGFLSYTGTLIGVGPKFEFIDEQVPSTPVLRIESIDFINPPSATLAWDIAVDNVGVVGYQLRKTASNGLGGIIEVGNTLSFVDTSVEYFNFYSYNVRACDAAGNKSPWSNKVLVNIPLPPDVPMPEYKMHQTGITKLHQNGVPKQHQ